MKAEAQQCALSGLRRWLEWKLGVDLIAAAGCIAVLLRGAQPPAQYFLVGAIGTFALSLLADMLMMGVLPAIEQRLPLVDEKGESLSVYDYRVWGELRMRRLFLLAFGLRILAMLLLFGWVVLKPTPVGKGP